MSSYAALTFGARSPTVNISFGEYAVKWRVTGVAEARITASAARRWSHGLHEALNALARMLSAEPPGCAGSG